MFSKLQWMRLKERIDYRKCTLVYKSQNSLGPQYISGMFTPMSEVHSRNTRSAANCDLYVPPGRHKEVYRQRFGYSGALAWNNLDPRIRECSTVNAFKCIVYVRNVLNGPDKHHLIVYMYIILIFY